MTTLAEIKARHIDSELGGYQLHEDVAEDCHRDRAWLLAECDRLREHALELEAWARGRLRLAEELISVQRDQIKRCTCAWADKTAADELLKQWRVG